MTSGSSSTTTTTSEVRPIIERTDSAGHLQMQVQAAQHATDTGCQKFPLDRRLLDRYYCERVLWIRLIARPSFQSVAAVLHDISPKGIGLVVHRFFATGTALAIQLQSKHTGVSDILTASVKHTQRLGDHRWLLGCSLSRSLAERELHSVMLRS